MGFLANNKLAILILGFVVLVFGTLALTIVLLANNSSKYNDKYKKKNDTGYIPKPDKEDKKPDETMPYVGKYAHAAVASDNVMCSKLGRDILKKNGTAVDAAIAVLYCVCTFNLQSCGVGGGFFMTVYQKPKDGAEMVMKQISARETAPAASTPNMYDNASSTKGGLAIGVPGQVHGSYMAWKKFGKMPWKDLITPTVHWLRNGFKIYDALGKAIAESETEIRSDSEFSKYFLKPDNSLMKKGDMLKLPKMADSLEKIANNPENFYSGAFAQDIADDIKDANGIITREDLEKYESHMKDAYKQKIPGVGLILNTISPPSSGAILALMLKIIDHINLTPGYSSTIKEKGDVYQIIVEAMKFGFAARTFIGDDRFVNNSKLLEDVSNADYIKDIVSRITLNTTHLIEYYNPANKSSPGDKGTSHFSVLAADGSAVGVTTTINTRFGSHVMGKRTGIIFNNEMDDFSLPNSRVSYGVNNLIEPGKRPLSSMVPSIYTNYGGKTKFVLGGEGGPTILTANFYAMVHRLWFGNTLEESIDMLRLHHQLIPNRIVYEKGYNQRILSELRLKGHEAISTPENFPISKLHGIENRCDHSDEPSKPCITAVSDRRKGGQPAGY